MKWDSHLYVHSISMQSTRFSEFVAKESGNDLDLEFDMQIQLYNIHELIVYDI